MKRYWSIDWHSPVFKYAGLDFWDTVKKIIEDWVVELPADDYEFEITIKGNEKTLEMILDDKINEED